jgi:NAD(P)-dependent dehydrogenase (short-subunit alcohol dehydrogenase family)
MDALDVRKLFDLTGKTAVVTGGAGVLCSSMCSALVSAGANVAVLDLDEDAARMVAESIGAGGANTLALACNVLDRSSIEQACQAILAEFDRVDILVNGAGGNSPKASTSSQQVFFDLPADTLRWVFELNLMGTILPSQVFGRVMAEQKAGIILNMSSMNSLRPLTRIPAYSSAKAAVNNFTQWLAVHMAQEYSPDIRVNAIAPGFFLTEQNRFLMTEKETGELTPRGKTILAHTPMNRFGAPGDLLGTLLWLVSPASAFVTGAVVPVDGGFSAFSGV